MRDRYGYFGDIGTWVAVSDMTMPQLRASLLTGTAMQGDLTEEAWRERIAIELVARGLPHDAI